MNAIPATLLARSGGRRPRWRPGGSGRPRAVRAGAALRRSAGGLALVLAAILPGQALAPSRPTLTPPASSGAVSPVPPPPHADPRRLALGRFLFESTELSHDGHRSCLTCHDTRTNGASPQAHDTTPDGKPLRFNTPTVFNAALDFRLGWEGKQRTLEEQAEASINSPRIMASNMPEVLAHLRADRLATQQFRDAYGRGPDRAALLDAIGTYERALVTPNAPFDRWLAGDANAMPADAQTGFRLFMQLGCISCHQGVNIGGNLFEEQGIFHPLIEAPPYILRVPSLRNIAVTAPYFHDGSTTTLDVAVRDMAHAQLDRSLSDDETAALVAFLHALTAPPPLAAR
jgi:cytochrome c peroxidase